MASKIPHADTPRADALNTAFRISRIQFTQGYGLLTALGKPAIAKALAMHAKVLQLKSQDAA